MLWVDPGWPVKAGKGQDKSILKCSPKCDAYTKMLMQGKSAFCPKWKKEKKVAYRVLFPQPRNSEREARNTTRVKNNSDPFSFKVGIFDYHPTLGTLFSLTYKVVMCK